MIKFLHLRFLRNHKITSNLQETESLTNYLLFGYFDALTVEKSENIQDCAFGSRKQNERGIPSEAYFCEAYQSLGLFHTEESEYLEIKKNLILDYPFKHSSEKLPFLSILHLTINPYYFIEHSDINKNDWIKYLKEKVILSFDEASDEVFFQIYQTVNSLDFCIIVISRNLVFAERLSNNLKKMTFSLHEKKYLAFTVYENIGIFRNFDDELVKKSFSSSHALITRIRVKDNYWNGLAGAYREEWDEKCRCSILSGRYHFSARIESPEEILSTLKEIIAFKFGEQIAPVEDKVNIIRRMLMENKIEYLNERLLCALMDYEPSLESEEISVPEYEYHDRTIYEILEKLRIEINGLEEKESFQVYLEKLENLYYTLKELSGNPDTYISSKMLTEYFASFLSGFKMTLDLVISMDGKKQLDDLIDQLKDGLRYLMQFISVICSINTTTFHAPKYEMIQDMNASPKFTISYTEFLREHVKKYRDSRAGKEEADLFPHYIPLIIPKMAERSENFFMGILYAQGFTDDWEQESRAWKAYIADKKNTPLFVICQKYKMFANISDVLVLSFHELGHYCNYLTRKERNGDLLRMIAKSLSPHIILAYRDAKETVHFLNRSEAVPQSKIEYFRALNMYLSKELYEYLLLETVGIPDAPEELFISYVICKSEALLAPTPSYYGKEALCEKAVEFVLEKTAYHFGNEGFKDESWDDKMPFEEKGKKIYKFVFGECCTEIDCILRKFDSLKEKLEKSCQEEDKCKDFRNYIEYTGKLSQCYLETVLKEPLEMLTGKEPKKLVGELMQYTVSVRKLLQKMKYANPEHCQEQDISIYRKCKDLYEQTYRIQQILYEYEILITNFFGNPEIRTASSVDVSAKREELIKKVCGKMVAYLDEDVKKKNKPKGASFTLWEHQMLARLQLVSHMEQEHFCTMLREAFFRTQNINENIRTLTKIYSEGFADLSMCQELSLDLKEYLTATAEYARFEASSEDDFRLSSIIIVVIVKMLKVENIKNIAEVYKKYRVFSGKIFTDLFEQKNKVFLEQIQYEKVFTAGCMPGNDFAKKFLTLIHLIRVKIADVATNMAVHPMIDHMLQHEQTKQCNPDILFVKEHLNYRFAESFGKLEKNEQKERKNRIQEKELAFMMKYYYKNRNRYMSESEADDKK